MSKLRWKIAQYAEIRWWHNYLKNKPTDDYLKWKISYWKDFLKKINVSLKPDSVVLDAGCGPAGIFIIMNDQKVDAVDPLIDSYQEKLNHFKKENYPAVSFFSKSLEDFVPNKMYDSIFCINVINHVKDLDASLKKIASSINPGGELIISIDTHKHKFLKYLFRITQLDILHPHQYCLADYRSMFIDHGFKITNEVRLTQNYFIFDYYVLVCSKK